MPALRALPRQLSSIHRKCRRTLKKYRPALFKLVELVECGAVEVFPTLVNHNTRIGEMLKKYPQMDLGDATLVALSEQFPRAKLITIDRTDFTIYRRKDGKLVPSIMPPVI